MRSCTAPSINCSMIRPARNATFSGANGESPGDEVGVDELGAMSFVEQIFRGKRGFSRAIGAREYDDALG